VALGFVGNYAPCGLSPQMYDMPAIQNRSANLTARAFRFPNRFHLWGGRGTPVTAYVVKFIRKNYLMQNYYELSLSAIPKSEYFFCRAASGGNQK
ncbi:MAG: hypothetical protein K2I26_01380, partial [Paramuribaculum sp.]|nr:hypothetical protein [Paramuribaculum sp.]